MQKMKTTYRAGTFETNSSSCHTLILPRKTDWEDKSFDPNTFKMTVKLTRKNSIEFGAYSGGILTTMREKLLYMWCAICHNKRIHQPWANYAERAIKEWLPSCIFVTPELSGSEDWACINHQSQDCAFVEHIMWSKELFYNVLLHGKISLQSDSREHIDDYEYDIVKEA